jgi:ABC-type lipoprotein release transport system permease subunit
VVPKVLGLEGVPQESVPDIDLTGSPKSQPHPDLTGWHPCGARTRTVMIASEGGASRRVRSPTVRRPTWQETTNDADFDLLSARGDTRVRTALYMWRTTWVSRWRRTLAAVLLCGLLGAVALGALAAARQTESAYGLYLGSINASDVLVNIPTPNRSIIPRVEGLPGVRAGAAWLGLDANPIVRGRVDPSFLDDSLVGSLGEGFSQDRMTVIEGRLPRVGAVNEIALTQGLARFFGVGVGAKVTYQFENPLVEKPTVTGYATYRVVGIVDVPPVLVDQFDDVNSAVLPPGATSRVLAATTFSWVGVRLAGGSAGVPAFQSSLASLARRLGVGDEGLAIRRLDAVHQQVQEAIRPQAVALGTFGIFAALALLVLVGQALGQLVRRTPEELLVLRASGATRLERGLTMSLDGAAVVGLGMALAVGGAVALSPLGPVGPVRQFDPARGFRFDATVLVVGGLILSLALLGLLALLAWGAVSRVRRTSEPSPFLIVRASRWLRLSVSAALGVRYALGPGRTGHRSVGRTNLFGSVVAVGAVVTAAVFGASLDGLVAHPVRYGWNWDVMIQSQGGYGTWPGPTMDKLMAAQPGVSGWSTFAFSQLLIDGQLTPVLGLAMHGGSVAPPTVSGHLIGGQNQIELGATTLRQLGTHVGDTVRVGAGPHSREMRIVGVVTLPAVGQQLTDHVTLGSGAMLEESDLLSIQGINPLLPPTAGAIPALPSTLVADVVPGILTTQLVNHIVAAEPDETPGGMYQIHQALAASIVNDSQMGSQPLTLSIFLAAAVTLSLILTVVADARDRRRELAVLKSLGLTKSQVGRIVLWQTSAILLVAVCLGGVLGVAAGRVIWRGFAASLGVVPVTQVPLEALVTGLVGLVVLGNLLAAAPAMMAARTPPAATLRRE